MRPAVENTLNKYPSVHVSFIGVGCSKETVLSDYSPSLHDRIDVVERYKRDDLPLLLKNYHVHLFPTLSEGLPITLFETMACGLAPVTTTAPGPQEVVTHGFNGLLIPPRDSEAIEGALRRLLDDTDELNRLRVNARNSVQKYTWSNAARQRLDLYQSLLSSE
jgi:glycosyltransferase involved in cell wall biosynthesis